MALQGIPEGHSRDTAGLTTSLSAGEPATATTPLSIASACNAGVGGPPDRDKTPGAGLTAHAQAQTRVTRVWLEKGSV